MPSAMEAYGLLVVCLFALLTTLTAQEDDESARDISFELCEHKLNNIRRVRVTPCSEEPCVMKKGTNIDLEVHFRAPLSSEKPRLTITARVLGMNAPFPGLKPNACVGMGIACPVKAGEDIVFKYKLRVMPFFPTISTMATFRVLEGHNDLFCFKVPVEVA